MGKYEKEAEARAKYAEQVMSFLDDEVRSAVDTAGYELLSRLGFDTSGCPDDAKAMAALAAELVKKRASLVYRVIPCEEKKTNIIYFVLIQNGRERGKSKKIEVQYIPREVNSNGDC